MEDEALLKINIEYLQHNTYTDIITFDNSDAKGKIESDIYISLERVEANAKIRPLLKMNYYEYWLMGYCIYAAIKTNLKGRCFNAAKEEECP